MNGVLTMKRILTVAVLALIFVGGVGGMSVFMVSAQQNNLVKTSQHMWHAVSDAQGELKTREGYSSDELAVADLIVEAGDESLANNLVAVVGNGDSWCAVVVYERPRLEAKFFALDSRDGGSADLYDTARAALEHCEFAG